MYLKKGHFLSNFDRILIKIADVGKNYANFASNLETYIFRNYILRAIFMANFRSLAHLYQKLTRAGR